jgi:predicted HicB family RNase H-like nuclease
MSRLTLRLPESLHRQLETLASREQTSLNQYIIYALTRQVTQSYLVQEHSEDAVDQQRTEFVALQKKLGQISPEAIDHLLAAREEVEPEKQLSTKLIRQLQSRIQNRRSAGHQKEPVKGRAGRTIQKAG